MKLSIIIPTHNRGDQLRTVLDSIFALEGEAQFELLIVDNNSTDNTKQIAASYDKIVRYVFEKRTSFTKARKTGEENATGEILLYLDDDVIVNPGSLRRIIEVFQAYPDCGVIAGKVLPKFIENPPKWCLECQKSFNGWSLYDPETYDFLQTDFQEVTSAAGPMMAIRRSAYQLAGGFPPDTVGVETNRGLKTFSKLYIGPGDYGLCLKIRDKGFKIYYSSDISVYHIIPPIRLTVKFWRSRMIGEGYQEAITQRGFFQLNSLNSFFKRLNFQRKYYSYEQQLFRKLRSLEKNSLASRNIEGMFPEEIWVRYYKAYLDMDSVLRKFPHLWEFLWKVGYDGVDNENYDYVVNYLPREYKDLVRDDFIYDPAEISSVADYYKHIKHKGYVGVKDDLFHLKAKWFIMVDRMYKIVKGFSAYLQNG